MVGLHILRGGIRTEYLTYHPKDGACVAFQWSLARSGSAEQEARTAGINSKQRFCMSVEVASQQKQVAPATYYPLGRLDSECYKTATFALPPGLTRA
jgi:hypothetical protein